MFTLPSPTGFHALEPRKAVWITDRHLPHWRQDGATYFVTSRLADSLPPPVRRDLMEKRVELFQANAPADAVRQFVQEIDHHLDRAHGRCWFADPARAAELARTLEYFHGTRYTLGAYCIMANHTHVLVTPHEGIDLSEILHSWHGFNATALYKREGQVGKVWYDESYDTIPRDREHLWNIIQYIGRNPWKAHIPEERWVRWVNPAW